MTARGRRFALLLVLPACVLPLGAAQAQDEVRKQDNVATAVTEQDGASTFALAWEVRKERGGVVDNLNTAQAGAKCTDCRATAIAFQIVLASGRPDQVAPVNRSLAYTDQCTRCVVYAGARQFVRVVDGKAKFDRDGRAELRDVHADLAALERQVLTADQLATEVDVQKARVLDVLLNDVVLKAHPGKHADELERHDDAADDDAS